MRVDIVNMKRAKSEIRRYPISAPFIHYRHNPAGRPQPTELFQIGIMGQIH